MSPIQCLTLLAVTAQLHAKGLLGGQLMKQALLGLNALLYQQWQRNCMPRASNSCGTIDCKSSRIAMWNIHLSRCQQPLGPIQRQEQARVSKAQTLRHMSSSAEWLCENWQPPSHEGPSAAILRILELASDAHPTRSRQAILLGCGILHSLFLHQASTRHWLFQNREPAIKFHALAVF